jgi:hypothetical protein
VPATAVVGEPGPPQRTVARGDDTPAVTRQPVPATAVVTVPNTDTEFEAEWGLLFSNNDKASWRKTGSEIEVKGNGAPAIIDRKDGADAFYDAYISAAGTYYIWLRTYAKDKNSNSAYIEFEGQDYGSVFHGQYGKWDWIRVQRSFKMDDSGTITLRIIRRELNFKVDKILLTERASL